MKGKSGKSESGKKKSAVLSNGCTGHKGREKVMGVRQQKRETFQLSEIRYRDKTADGFA